MLFTGFRVSSSGSRVASIGLEAWKEQIWPPQTVGV